jgi:NADH:ubiquinone oxidoreductase subunit C
MCRAVRAVVYIRAVFVVKVAKCRALCLLKFLHSHIKCQFKSLADIIVYDTPYRGIRYTLMYNLLSIAFNKRLLVVVYTKNTVRSVCSVYAGAG